MADDHLFLLPIVIDATAQADARVPDRFQAVQWLRVPEGKPNAALKALGTRLVSGGTVPAPTKRPPLVGKTAAAERPLPPFPLQEPGQPVKFWFHVAGWLLRSGWIRFQRLPRFIRILAYLWLAFAAINFNVKKEASERIPPAKVEKLKEIAKAYETGASKGPANAGDVAKLGVDIARAIGKEIDDNDGAQHPLLAIPFSTGEAPAEAKLANTTFALLYGRISVSRQGKVGLSAQPLPPPNVTDAQARGQLSHATYVILGGIEASGSSRVLTVKIVEVSDGTVAWTKSYPVDGADSEAIASEVERNLPKADED
jgi:hypothetical protein